MNIVEIKKIASETRQLHPRVYFWIKNENVLQNLQNRRCRPVEAYRTLLPKLFKEIGLDEKTLAKWSQRAGCACGCSPAFILTKTNMPFDFHVTIE